METTIELTRKLTADIETVSADPDAQSSLIREVCAVCAKIREVCAEIREVCAEIREMNTAIKQIAARIETIEAGPNTVRRERPVIKVCVVRHQILIARLPRG